MRTSTLPEISMSDEVLAAAGRATEPVVLVIVADVQGSAPRHLGAMMLFRPDGTVTGTVGGGKVEMEAAKTASRCLESGTSTCIEIAMTGAETAGRQAICGGVVQLLVEYVADPAMYARAALLLAGGKAAVIAVDRLEPGLSRPGGLARAVFDRSGCFVAGDAGVPFGASAGLTDVGAVGGGGVVTVRDIFWIRIMPPERLLILGGGHVGLALAKVAAELDFIVSVGDERPEFAAGQRFPAGVETILGSYTEIIRDFEFGDSAYVVVATPGHQSDLACVEALMRRGISYLYVGLIGSRRKAKMILDTLAAEGFDAGRLQALHAPVGLDIGAETPAEIAISIAAQMIAVRRNSTATAVVLAMDRDRRTI